MDAAPSGLGRARFYPLGGVGLEFLDHVHQRDRFREHEEQMYMVGITSDDEGLAV
jgi:hypothetical protein